MTFEAEATGCFLGAPPPVNEPARLRALRAYGVLDTSAEQAFDELAGLAALCCDMPISLLSLVDRDRQWFKARRGMVASETARNLSFCAHAILEPDEVMVVQDARRDPRFADNPLVTGEPGIISYAGAPLVTPTGEAIGTLCVADRRPRQITATQTQLLKGLAVQAMTQLELRRSLMTLEATIESQTRYVDELERQQESLEHQNATDPLTGIGNRRGFELELDAALALASRKGHSVGLVVLDVDHFKRYNDSFGHPAGDGVLKQLAGVLQQCCRGNDFAARIGGEEFALVLPGITRESLFVLAERLRRGVQRAVWLNRPVTVSVGAALAYPREGSAQLTDRADVAMYRSKNDGRNRVTLAAAADYNPALLSGL